MLAFDFQAAQAPASRNNARVVYPMPYCVCVQGIGVGAQAATATKSPDSTRKKNKSKSGEEKLLSTHAYKFL